MRTLRLESLSFHFVVCATTLGLGCTEAPAPTELASSQALSSSVKSAPSVPFKGSGTGQDLSVVFEPSGVHIVAAVTGNGTGIGKFTEVLDYVLAYDFVHFGGTAVMTAADGSKLSLSFNGTIPGFASQVFPIPYTASYTLTGGTGRLAGTTGSGIINGIDFGAGKFELSFDGTRTTDGGAP